MKFKKKEEQQQHQHTFIDWNVSSAHKLITRNLINIDEMGTKSEWNRLKYRIHRG